MTCPLCEREPRTHLYHEDDLVWVVDCSSCGTPMIVWKEHVDQLTPEENQHVCQVLEELFGHWDIDGVRRTIPDHWHAHVLGEEGFQQPDTQDGAWLQDNPLSPEAYSEEHQPCALTRPVGDCPDDRSGVHFATDWGLAARYALFKAQRSDSIGIVLEYDLGGLELVPDHDVFVEKDHGDDWVKEVNYYIEEFDILADPESPDYDRLADLFEGEAESFQPDMQEPPYSVETALVEAAKTSIFSILAERLRHWDTADQALKAIQDADVPLEWWAESIAQVRTFSEVNDERLLRVLALKPVEMEASDLDISPDLQECPESIGMEDLDNLADHIEGLAVVLWESRQTVMRWKSEAASEVHYHGTDLTRAKLILAGTPAASALKNPWDPCVQP